MRICSATPPRLQPPVMTRGYEKEKKLQESTKKIPTNKVGKDQNLVKSMNNYFVEILQKKDKKNNISNNTGIKIVNNELRILKKEILENL